MQWCRCGSSGLLGTGTFLLINSTHSSWLSNLNTKHKPRFHNQQQQLQQTQCTIKHKPGHFVWEVLDFFLPSSTLVFVRVNASNLWLAMLLEHRSNCFFADRKTFVYGQRV